jgi:hypothetical protein
MMAAQQRGPTAEEFDKTIEALLKTETENRK